MKNIFKQSSVKFVAISIAICGASLLGYNAYSNATMTPEERLFQQNLEALTDIEERPNCDNINGYREHNTDRDNIKSMDCCYNTVYGAGKSSCLRNY